MRAQDLRIGNWVNSQFGGIQQVVDVMCDGVNTLKYEGINYEFIDPIPLTEEWLLKFGFSDITEHCAVKVRNQKEFCISFFVDNCTEQQTMFVTLGSKGWTFKRVGSPLYKHVHQLQNLYFALTDEELTFKNEQR